MAVTDILPDHFTRNYLDRFTVMPTPAISHETLLKWAVQQHEAGRPVADIMHSLELTRKDVLGAIGLNWTCEGCGMAVDLETQGTDHATYVVGDESYGFYGTECCLSRFIDRNGVEYSGPNPAAEGW